MATDLNDELEKLKKAYVAELPDKSLKLTRAAERAIQDLAKQAAPNWRELETLSHKLAGSSGTYGFPALSSVTRHLEIALSEGVLQHLDPTLAGKYLSTWSSSFTSQLNAICKGGPTPSETEVMAALESALGKSRKAA